MVQPELYLTLRVQDGTVVPRVTCDVVVLAGAHLGLLVSIVATKSPDLTFVEDKGKKCFLGRHRCQHFDSLAVIVQTAHQFVAVATYQVITLVRGDEDLGEMGLERHSITSHRPPPELSIRVASLRLLLVVLHYLPCPFLPKFFQIDRIDIHIGDTAALCALLGCSFFHLIFLLSYDWSTTTSEQLTISRAHCHPLHGHR